MREIPLTQGKVALVDDEDYERVAALKWCVTGIGHRRYTMRATEHAGRMTKLSIHRYILGCPPGQEVDHINGDGLDNRRCNLRLCSHSQNLANQRKQTRPTSSRFKGVCWNKDCRRWQAYIKHDGRLHYLGLFDSEEEAARAYNAKARQLFGEFAYLNITGHRLRLVKP